MPSLPETIGRVQRDYDALARFAQRRERFLAALDWRCIDAQTTRATEREDERTNDDLASLWMYLDHLEEQNCASTCLFL